VVVCFFSRSLVQGWGFHLFSPRVNCVRRSFFPASTGFIQLFPHSIPIPVSYRLHWVLYRPLFSRDLHNIVALTLLVSMFLLFPPGDGYVFPQKFCPMPCTPSPAGIREIPLRECQLRVSTFILCPPPPPQSPLFRPFDFPSYVLFVPHPRFSTKQQGADM